MCELLRHILTEIFGAPKSDTDRNYPEIMFDTIGENASSCFGQDGEEAHIAMATLCKLVCRVAEVFKL